MKNNKITTDKNVVEEAISWLSEYKNRLEKVEEINEYQQGVHHAIYCLTEAIDGRIDYLQDVLSWYEENPKTHGTYEVINEFESFLQVFLELSQEAGNSSFEKGMVDTYHKNLMFFAINLYWIDTDNDKMMEVFEYLSNHGVVAAMIKAATIYLEREQYKKAQRMYEKATSLGSSTAAEYLMEMVDYGYILESDLKKDYGIAKINCAICGNEIHDIDYMPCKICGWCHTLADSYLKEWEKDPYNLMSRKKAKRLYANGLTKWKKPLPYFKEEI